jgi:hypothetical protein
VRENLNASKFRTVIWEKHVLALCHHLFSVAYELRPGNVRRNVTLAEEPVLVLLIGGWFRHDYREFQVPLSLPGQYQFGASGRVKVLLFG